MISRSRLVESLKKSNIGNPGFINQLKIIYRPYICPFDELLDLISPSKSIFDIGCGNGMFLSLAARFCNPLSLGGVEISDALIHNARSLIGNSGFNNDLFLQKYDGQMLPERIQDFDYIFLIDVLHHIPPARHASLMTQVNGKMKTGSKFIIKDIDAGKWLWTRFNKLHDLLLSGEVGNEISSDACKKLLTSCGFSIVRSSYKRMFWYPHYTIIAEKK